MNLSCRLFAEKTGLMAEAERMEFSGVRDADIFNYLYHAYGRLLADTQRRMIAGLIQDRIQAGGTVDSITARLVHEIAAIEADQNLFAIDA